MQDVSWFWNHMGCCRFKKNLYVNCEYNIFLCLPVCMVIKLKNPSTTSSTQSKKPPQNMFLDVHLKSVVQMKVLVFDTHQRIFWSDPHGLSQIVRSSFSQILAHRLIYQLWVPQCNFLAVWTQTVVRKKLNKKYLKTFKIIVHSQQITKFKQQLMNIVVKGILAT